MHFKKVEPKVLFIVNFPTFALHLSVFMDKYTIQRTTKYFALISHPRKRERKWIVVKLSC